MEPRETAQFRATAGDEHEFGATPEEALNSLMERLSDNPPTPIVIWPYNRADAYFSASQQARLKELSSRRDSLSAPEREELEQLIEASFDATISRTRSMPVVKT